MMKIKIIATTTNMITMMKTTTMMLTMMKTTTSKMIKPSVPVRSDYESDDNSDGKPDITDVIEIVEDGVDYSRFRCSC